MNQRTFFAALLSAALAGAAHAAGPLTVAVLPFSPQDDASRSWLAAGISDLFARHLAQLSDVTVVERDRMRDFLNEMELADAPLFNTSDAVRAGRVARVQNVIYGRYRAAAGRLTITAFVLDLNQQNVVATEEAEGAESALVPLVRDLTQRLMAKRGRPLDDKDRARLQLRITDSVGALEHFYRGIDAYDHGRYPDAWGEFFAAARADPRYADARLWMGRLFEAMGQDAHAVLAYREAFQAFPRSPEALDALLLAARLLEERLHDPARALIQLRAAAQLSPDSPHALEASFRMGRILEAQGDLRGAYAAYRFIERFVARTRLDKTLSYRADHPVSRFFGWGHALSLYPDAVTHAILVYGRLVDLPGPEVSPPLGVIVLSTATAAFDESRFDATPSLFPDAPQSSMWHEVFYAAVAPAGQVITGADLRVTGILNIAQPNRDYTFRVLPFPMPRQFFRRWLGVIYGQTPDMRTLSKSVDFAGPGRKVVMLQLIENGSRIRDWGIRLHLTPTGTAKSRVPAAVDSTKTFYEGRPIAHIPVPDAAFTGSTRDSTEAFFGPARKLALLAPTATQPGIVVSVRGELAGEATDLTASFSAGASSWTALAPLPINSASDDYDPRLVRGEDGKARLFWISNRRGRGWELWWSAWSSDGRGMTSPQRVPLETFGDPGMEKTAEKRETLLEYDVTQDQRGGWRVAYFSRANREMVFLRSRDLSVWEKTAAVSSDPTTGLSLLDDPTDHLYMSGFVDSGEPRLWSSVDGAQWTVRTIAGWRSASPGVARSALLATNGALTLLATDQITGLQYGKVATPDQPAAAPDLVARCGIEAYAAAPVSPTETWAVFERSDTLDLLAYRGFQTSGWEEKGSTPGWAIYTEREKDGAGNRWTHYFARERFRVPDVTSLAVEPDGRIWWGVEAGIMSVKGSAFFATDVSQGFINNDISRIMACPGVPTLLSSHNVPDPMIGWVDTSASLPAGRQAAFRAQTIPGAHGAVVGLACAGAGAADVETSDGRVWRGSPSRGWTPSPRKRGIDPGYGHRATDAQGGVWAIAGVAATAPGLTYTRGAVHRRYQPPHDVFDAPTAVALDAQGNVWVGTAFKGLYKLEARP